MIRFIEVEIAGLVSLGPVDKSAVESYLCKRADVVKVYLNQKNFPQRRDDQLAYLTVA